MGVRHFFDAVVLSVETGWRKPHPGISAVALDGLGIGPQQAVFVGIATAPTTRARPRWA
jgi:putative hydrolase of the HAD superfamily